MQLTTGIERFSARSLRRCQTALGKWREPQRQVLLRLGDQPHQPPEHTAREPPPHIRRWPQFPRQTRFHASHEVLPSSAGRPLEGVLGGVTGSFVDRRNEDLFLLLFCLLGLPRFSSLFSIYILFFILLLMSATGWLAVNVQIHTK